MKDHKILEVNRDKLPMKVKLLAENGKVITYVLKSAGRKIGLFLTKAEQV